MCRELCNECHTSDNYEANHGIVQGSLLHNWKKQQAAFLKRTLGVKQVTSSHPFSSPLLFLSSRSVVSCGQNYCSVTLSTRYHRLWWKFSGVRLLK